MTSKPDSPINSEKRPLSAMKKHGQPAKPKRRVRFDLSNLKSAIEDASQRSQPSEMALASQLFLMQGSKRRHSADNISQLVKNENRRIASRALGRPKFKLVSNERGMFSVMEGPDFIFTQRIKAYRDDKRKTSTAVQVQPQASTSIKGAAPPLPPRSLCKLVKQKREQNDLLRDFQNGKVSKELRTSRRDVRSLPVPADLLHWRLEQLYVEQQMKKLNFSPGD